MAVRRKLHQVIGKRGGFYMFAQKVRIYEAETEDKEDKEVLRPVRNRRWQF